MLYVYSVAFANGAQELGLGSAINVLTILLILVMLIPFIRGVFKEARAAA
jgi:multiple sugar transport system permease protein/N,N'-diacetylchitobiose transport system permease protein